MSSSRSRLDASITSFAGELRSFVQRASDSITALKRTVEQTPQAGVQDFKECLEDLEQQVADTTDEIQQLVRCTADTTSFVELIGHCTAVYEANRTAILSLEQHLEQYGYCRPPGAVLEPESLQDARGLQDDGDGDYSLDAEGLSAGRASWALPSSSVSRGSLTALRAAAGPSRLGLSQPGSPVTGSAGGSGSGASAGIEATVLRMQGNAARADARTGASSMLSHTTRKPAAGAGERVSLGSNTSSTPAGLFISPGVAALASKYATSSVGGSSVGGGLSAPDAPPATRAPGAATAAAGGGPLSSACRDLTLSYINDAASPELPIFGRTATPASAAAPGTAGAAPGGVAHEQQALQQQRQQQRQPLAALLPQTPATAAAAGGDEDSTGELYSSLIHSNFGRRGQQQQHRSPAAAGGSGVRAAGGGRPGATPAAAGAAAACSDDDDDDDDEEEDEPATPLYERGCSRGGSGSPDAPPTAGRLPANWMGEKMQQLQNLQADVTLTLSQMKRCPSRSRTASATPEGSEDGCDDERRADTGPPSPGSRQQQQAAGQSAAAATAAPACVPERVHAQHATAVKAVTAAAAAASADLENLMASLSMKYACSEQQQQPVAVSPEQAASPAPGSAVAAADGGVRADRSVSEGASPTVAGLSKQYGNSGTQPHAASSPASSFCSPTVMLPAAAAAAERTPEPASASPYTGAAGAHSPEQQQGQQGVGSSLLTPATQQVIRRAVAAGLESTAAARPQSSIRRMQPTTDVKHLEGVRGLYQQAGVNVVAQQLDSRLAALGPSASAADTATHASSSLHVTEPAVLRSVQPQQQQQRSQQQQQQQQQAAADLTSGVSLRQKQQRSAAAGNENAHQAAPGCDAAGKQQEAVSQPGEQLTPRAARMQRRLQLRLQLRQQEVGGSTPGKDPPAAAAPAGPVKAAPVSDAEFERLPGWCKGLLSCALLNSVLEQLGERCNSRAAGDDPDELQQLPGSFTADDVEALGHSSSKSKTIVSCLHKLSRATLQRSAAGGNFYRLASGA